MSTPDSVLKNTFGFDAFRPGQKDIIDGIIAGENMLAVMPTGAGKSLCYQIPALILEGVTVIISPLVALMDNQAAGLRVNGVAVASIHSGQSREENIDQWRLASHGDAKLLYLSPERLMNGRMLSAIKALGPSMFVIDEAHCVSKWGPAFRPEYDQLSQLKDMFPDAVIAAFTATADEGTRGDIAHKLFASKGQIVVQGFDRPNLSLGVTAKSNRKAQLLAFMETVKGQSGIVYCLSRKSTQEMAEALVAAGHKALPYNAGLDARVRFDNQERFMAEEGVVMVATIAFGMGIDKPDIRFVYHLNLPGSLEAYYQEIGRAGRDGAPAITSMLYGMDDVRMRRQFITQDGSDNDHQMREHKRLDALLAYCEAPGCRRQVLLSYFGETTPPCGNCDNCESPPKMVDATDAIITVLNAMEATGQRFGTAHVIDVTRGRSTDRTKQFGHEEHAAFGGGKEFGKPYLQALIRQAIASGVINLDINQYGALKFTDQARAVLSGAARFECKAIEKTKKMQRSSRNTAAQSSLSERDGALLQDLKALRTTLAKQLGKPAYIVFSDATLMDMAQKRPGNEPDMLDVSGVGATKFERFGTQFLEVIARQ